MENETGRVVKCPLQLMNQNIQLLIEYTCTSVNSSTVTVFVIDIQIISIINCNKLSSNNVHVKFPKNRPKINSSKRYSKFKEIQLLYVTRYS